MSKQKRNSTPSADEHQASQGMEHLGAQMECLLRERRTLLEQMLQSERENQSLRQRASHLEQERDHLSRQLQDSTARPALPSQQALHVARKVAGRVRHTLLQRTQNVKRVVRPLYGTLKRAESRVMGPLDSALDYPASEQQVGLSLHVSGWAASNSTQVKSVKVWLNDIFIGDASLDVPRPDVLAARPWSTTEANCGFAGTFGINPFCVPPGDYTLRVCIQDDQGNKKELSRPVKLTQNLDAYPTLHPEYYRAWIARNEPDAAGLTAQRTEQAGFAYRPLVSIVTPVYNTPVDVLREMLRSVREQTYPKWELCLVDGNSTNPQVRELLREASAQDGRIRVQFLERNLGISGNTNAALAMSRGDFLALLDHDDTLAPFALYEVIKHLNAEPETDIIYSDEDRVNMDGTRHTVFFKPAWSPDLLQSFMYTGHLTVYRRSLVEELGGFRAEFDLSQDYDLALRITERTQAIAHIPKVLYHWRTLPGSGAAGDKPHARATNIAALADAMKRRGHEAEVFADPMANRVKFKAPRDAFASIVIPSDNAQHIRECVENVLRTTAYPHYELLIVTNSKLIPGIHARYAHEPRVRSVTFDEPFNFSLKCNRGVEQAKGDFVLFLNDDARPLEPEWLECMLGYFQQEGVGAVSPKLVYTNNTLQHAGMVSGVRNLVGTAFHTLPWNTSMYFNLAQSTRTTSLLSAACLLMRKSVFEDVGGFDAVNTPIMHSDVDLCFKIREVGLRLVYTPFTTLEHVGHVSLAAEERKGNLKHSHKSDIYVLKRWSEYCSHDPYFPDHMREFLYFDSPTPYRMQAGTRCERKSTKYDILLASHDLTQSGAPILLQVLANALQQDNFVTVISPTAGKLLEKYREQNTPVIVDPLIMDSPNHLEKFISEFDLVVANTLLHWPLVLKARQMGKPVIWYVHEGQTGVRMAESNPNIAQALAVADQVIFPGEMIVAMYERFAKGNHRAVLHGWPERKSERALLPRSANRIRIAHIGSVEPRKGQDVLVKAIQALGAERDGFEFYFLGRVLHRPYYVEQLEATMNLSHVHWLGEVPSDEVLDYLVSADALVCSSRDECLPLVVVDALAQRRPVIATQVGMLPEIIEDAHNGLLVKSEDAEGLAQALLKLKDAALRQRLAEAGRTTMEQRLGYERYGQEVRELIDLLLAKKPASQERVALG